ncbi:MAG: tRNA pseudouridine(38-40) synthase TruA [Clostridia bacterium]|nr:tRNA pseudouridine(38-40) synthase TruA [Clostridia bacterium]
MKKKILLTLAYDGTHYAGFQVQPDAPTVQAAVQDAIEQIYLCRPDVTGCSRTDAGVHARDYKLMFVTDDTMPKIPAERIPAALNTVLPRDIAVLFAEEVPMCFHVRHDVYEKEYEYIVWNSAVRDPFSADRAYLFRRPLDADALNAAGEAFVGTHGFRGFVAAGAVIAATVRTVRSVSVRREGKRVIFAIAADGFLYNMVRIFVGTMLAVAEGKIPAESLPDVIASRDRSRAGMTVPACGLYLNRVEFRRDAFDSDRKENTDCECR